MWDLPGADMEGPMKWVIGGWQWTGVMQFQTGQPFNIVSGLDNSRCGIGSNNDRAKLTGQALEPPTDSDQTVIFNAAAFAVNDVGTFGDNQRAISTGHRCTAGTWGCSRTSGSRTT